MFIKLVILKIVTLGTQLEDYETCIQYSKLVIQSASICKIFLIRLFYKYEYYVYSKKEYFVACSFKKSSNTANNLTHHICVTFFYGDP